VALQLRTLQTMAEISVEKNSTIIFPAQFMTTVPRNAKHHAEDASTRCAEVTTTSTVIPR
jgi:hypothetical protein